MSETAPHYVVICIGTTGDIHPFMRIAKALQSLGRQVTVITNTYNTRLFKGSGLPCVGMGTDEDYLRVIQNPDVWDEKKAFKAILAQYQDQMAQLESAVRSVTAAGPAIAVAHPFAVPGAAICRERGSVSSIVSMYLAPSTIRTCHDPMRIGSTLVPRWWPMSWRRTLWWVVEKGWIDPAGIKALNAARSALNLPAAQATSFLGHIEAEPDLTVTLFPEWFGPTMPDWPRPLLRGDFQLFDALSQDAFSVELRAFLAAGDRPLVFTHGTGNLFAQAFFATSLAATLALGRRAIFLTKERDQVPAQLPESVLWLPYVPLSGLLPQVDALIHHGGIGTTAEALRAGTPQLVVPLAWDQFDNGARAAELGAGAVIPAKKLGARKLVDGIRSLLTSERVRAGCGQVAGRFTPRHDPVALCAEIERRVWPMPALADAA